MFKLGNGATILSLDVRRQAFGLHDKTYFWTGTVLAKHGDEWVTWRAECLDEDDVLDCFNGNYFHPKFRAEAEADAYDDFDRRRGATRVEA